MQFCHVSASNWRTFRTLGFDLGSRLFVVGPNASGKSHLLDLFRFLGDLSEPGGGLASAVERRGGLRRLRSAFADDAQAPVVIDVRLADGAHTWRYRLDIRADEAAPDRPLVDEEIVEFDGVTVVRRPDSADSDDPALLTQTHLEQISTNRSFRVLAEHFAATRYVHPVPQFMRGTGRGGEFARSFEGDLVARIGATAPAQREERLATIRRALTAAVPGFTTLDVDTDRAGLFHLVTEYGGAARARHTEADLSDGTLRLIGLLWSLISAPAGSGIVLLEEPELSLNQAVVRALPEIIASAQQGRPLQVVASTHAPVVLDDEGVRADEVLVLRPTEAGTTATLLSGIETVADEIAADLPTSDIVEGLIAPPDLTGLVAAADPR